MANKPPQKKRNFASPKVATHEYQFLNHEYYRGDPHGYLRNRLYSLAAMVSDGNEAVDAMRNEVSFGDFKMSLGSNHQWDVEDKMKYASAESTILLHHACETLLRLYLSHSFRNPCPWVEMSKLTSAAEFKREVTSLRGRITNESCIDDLLEVFAYANQPTTWGEQSDGTPIRVDDDTWSQYRNALPKLIDFAAKEFLEQSSVYNSAKHGLALISSAIGIRLGDADDPVIEQEGPALKYLHKIRQESGEQRWQLTTQWVPLQLNMGRVAVIADQIENLWISARVHHKVSRETNDVLKLHYISTEIISSVLDGHLKEGVNVGTMSVGLHQHP